MRKTTTILNLATRLAQEKRRAACEAQGLPYPPPEGTEEAMRCQLDAANLRKFAALLAPAIAAEGAGRYAASDWLIKDAQNKYDAYAAQVAAYVRAAPEEREKLRAAAGASPSEVGADRPETAPKQRRKPAAGNQRQIEAGAHRVE